MKIRIKETAQAQVAIEIDDVPGCEDKGSFVKFLNKEQYMELRGSLNSMDGQWVEIK